MTLEALPVLTATPGGRIFITHIPWTRQLEHREVVWATTGCPAHGWCRHASWGLQDMDGAGVTEVLKTHPEQLIPWEKLSQNSVPKSRCQTLQAKGALVHSPSPGIRTMSAPQCGQGQPWPGSREDNVLLPGTRRHRFQRSTVLGSQAQGCTASGLPGATGWLHRGRRPDPQGASLPRGLTAECPPAPQPQKPDPPPHLPAAQPRVSLSVTVLGGRIK